MAEANPSQAAATVAPISPGLPHVSLVETTKPSPFESPTTIANGGAGLDTCREEEPLNKFDGRLRRGSWVKARSLDKSMDNISSLVHHD